MTSIILNNNLKAELSQRCENRYDTICQHIKFEITYLFRNVGMLYNRYCESHGVAAGDSGFDEMGSELQERYGPYFSRENILRMVQFDKHATACPELFRLIYYITWEHIVLLLPFDDFAAWLYYIRLTEKNGLSVAELQEAITSKAFEQDETFVGKKNLKRAIQKSLSHGSPDETFLPLWFMKHQREWKPLFNAFKEPLLSSFKPLMEIREYLLKHLTNTGQQDLLTEISDLVDGTRLRLNQAINEQLNLLFWETGMNLFRDLHNPPPAPISNQQYDQNLVHAVHMVDTGGKTHHAKTLTQQQFEQEKLKRNQKFEGVFKTLFTADQLTLMLEFATKVSDGKLAIQICHLATWEQLKELIVLNDQDQILGMAFKIPEQNLNGSDVRKLVKHELQNPAKKKKTKLTVNSIYNKKVAANIFYNNLFMELVLAF